MSFNQCAEVLNAKSLANSTGSLCIMWFQLKLDASNKQNLIVCVCVHERVAVFATDCYYSLLIACRQKKITITILLRQGNPSMAGSIVWEFLPFCGPGWPPTHIAGHTADETEEAVRGSCGSLNGSIKKK